MTSGCPVNCQHSQNARGVKTQKYFKRVKVERLPPIRPPSGSAILERVDMYSWVTAWISKQYFLFRQLWKSDEIRHGYNADVRMRTSNVQNAVKYCGDYHESGYVIGIGLGLASGSAKTPHQRRSTPAHQRYIRGRSAEIVVDDWECLQHLTVTVAQRDDNITISLTSELT